MSFIRLDHVSFIRNGISILSDINWTLEKNEHWILLGPNGSGKTTLISLIAGQEWPSSGKMEIAGHIPGNCDLLSLKKIIGLFEPSVLDSFFSNHPFITAGEVICTGLDASMGVYRDYDDTTVIRARSLLNSTFLQSGFHLDENRLYRHLSSGEKRKILFLRILMSNPELIIFDEPFESLDIPSRAMLESIFNKYLDFRRIPGITVLHRIEEIPLTATHALLLKNGKIFAQGPIENIIVTNTLSELFDTDLQIERHGRRYVSIIRQQ